MAKTCWMITSRTTAHTQNLQPSTLVSGSPHNPPGGAASTFSLLSLQIVKSRILTYVIKSALSVSFSNVNYSSGLDASCHKFSGWFTPTSSSGEPAKSFSHDPHPHHRHYHHHPHNHHSHYNHYLCDIASVQSILGGTSMARRSSRSFIIGWPQYNLDGIWILNQIDVIARWTCGLVQHVENLSVASQSLSNTLRRGIQTWQTLVRATSTHCWRGQSTISFVSPHQHVICALERELTKWLHSLYYLAVWWPYLTAFWKQIDHGI